VEGCLGHGSHVGKVVFPEPVRPHGRYTTDGIQACYREDAALWQSDTPGDASRAGGADRRRSYDSVGGGANRIAFARLSGDQCGYKARMRRLRMRRSGDTLALV
jgi:hypothetical protein